MQRTHAGLSRNMEDWKGDDIFKFQEDLQYTVKEYISEKSFYNHFKTYNERLPRIDLLNILSKYAGFTDWADFKNANKEKVIRITGHTGSNLTFYLLPAIALLIFLMVWIIIKVGSSATYTFCFVDNLTREPISNSKIEVDILFDNESPLQLLGNKDGCFTYKTSEQKIKFLVKTPYYFQDTIHRSLHKSRKSEVIPLRTDNYALMINYYANSKINDWKKRREQLELIIADSAYIYQVFTNMAGMELFNKEEFINMLTIPTSSLKNIELIELLNNNNKITFIKFKQKEGQK
ncbi:MAG: hypothetical protein JW830_13450 [Bacteroidales bacterium]|nr:hypothetical protein [Bacteroidales bacterium]